MLVIGANSFASMADFAPWSRREFVLAPFDAFPIGLVVQCSKHFCLLMVGQTMTRHAVDARAARKLTITTCKMRWNEVFAPLFGVCDGSFAHFSTAPSSDYKHHHTGIHATDLR